MKEDKPIEPTAPAVAAAAAPAAASASAPAVPPVVPPVIAAPKRSGLRRDLAFFAAIVVVAFGLRYLFLFQARAVPLFNALIMDGESYGNWADKIAAGDWLGDKIFYQAPLYPYFLAVVKLAFGDDLHTIRIVQIVLGSLACGILFLAGRAWFSHRAGAVAGFLLAVYPPAIFFDALIQKANLGLLWTVLLLWSLAHARVRPTGTRWVACGAVLALLMLTREETILLVPAISLWIFFVRRQEDVPTRARWFCGLVVGLALILAPVGFRNWKVGGEFLITTSQAGSNFFMGNNPNATGMYMPLKPGRSNTAYERQDAIDLAEQALKKKLTPNQVSNYWFGQSFAFIRAQPKAWVTLMGKKLMLLINAYEFPDYEDQYFFERYCSLIRVPGYVWNYGVLVPLAAAGFALTWRRRRELSMLYLLMGTIGAGVILFYVFARYRYPLVPIFVLFAAAGVVEAIARVRAKDFLGLGPAIVAMLVSAPLVNWPMFSKDFQLPQAHNNAGMALAKLGRDAEAVEQFQTAISLRPGVAEMYGNLGVALVRMERYREAIDAFNASLKIKPDDARGEARLGVALGLAGETEQALVHLTRSITLAPTNAEAWSHLTKNLVRARRFSEALRSARRHVELAPKDLDANVALARILATCPDASLRNGAEAVALIETMVSKDETASYRAWDTLGAAYAEAARFDDALRAGTRALAAARGQNASENAREIEARLGLYRQGTPFHEP